MKSNLLRVFKISRLGLYLWLHSAGHMYQHGTRPMMLLLMVVWTFRFSVPNGTENDCTDFPQKLFVANRATRVGGLCGVHGRTTAFKQRRVVVWRLLTLTAPPRASGFIDRRRKNPAAALPREGNRFFFVFWSPVLERGALCVLFWRWIFDNMYAQRFDYIIQSESITNLKCVAYISWGRGNLPNMFPRCGFDNRWSSSRIAPSCDLYLS